MKYLVTTLILLLIGVTSFSQLKSTGVVTGTVTSMSDVPLGYVTVRIWGRTNGTRTKADGSYELRGVKNGDSIVFTHVEYQRLAVLVDGNNVVNVKMEKNRPYEYLSVKVEDKADVVKTNEAIPAEPDKWKYIFEKVEIYPNYKGGEKALKKYIDSALKYPAAAKEKNIEGTVVIGFTVSGKNEVKDVKVVKGIFPECDEAAMDVIKGTKWVCAIQNGLMVDYYLEISIDFDLTNVD